MITDDTVMPFGTHKGTKIKDVPAGYLIWLYECEFAWVEEKHPEIYDYIEENLEQIESEMKGNK